MKLQTLYSLLGFSLLCIGATARAEVDLGSASSSTPYDPYLTPIWPILRQLNGKADVATAAQLVRQGKAFRYSFNKALPYTPQTPAETEAKKSGDCKAKS